MGEDGGHLPPWATTRGRKRRQNAVSREQEKRHAESTGGKVQPGSGSSHRARQDVVGPLEADGSGYLDQHKGTTKRSFTFKLDEWDGLERDADLAGRSPRFVIEFTREGRKFYLVEADD